MIDALEALARLREGNKRFATGVRSIDTMIAQAHKPDLVAGQAPFAVILGCSDSRVPVEIVFDQGLGDLFVIRVAGNVVASSQIGSVEFAAESFGTRLVVVLGHSSCGAVSATLDTIRNPDSQNSPGLLSIVNRIRPAIEELVHEDDSEPVLKHRAVRSNVRMAAQMLRSGSALLERLILNDGLLVVGAEYSLETGLVDFFDGLPPE
ncbi:carbonic anhydrase [Ruficoccus sp. ZRK36]|uniref:carbonic anhydrase n=1 Tax=Ruficoccus sp. ZRK36 TaxID=2866311 RepID=UPI001C73A85C|nr:carbonic anhydrase [Ruficoccus sp. ZRK36]QYY34422.1 carbonic anhydrase [Ruficoccus sp. ZRK36]